MQRQFEARVEALHERDRTGRAGSRRPLAEAPGGAPLVREDHAQHLAQRGRGELRIGCEVVADLARERRHVLAHRDARQNSIHEMGGRIRHPPPTARWADAPLARERDQVLEPAAEAEDAGEAVRPDATAQVPLELALDVPWKTGPVRARGGELVAQGVELARHEAVEQGAFGRARPVRRSRAAGRQGHTCPIEPRRRLVLHCEVHACLQRACQVGGPRGFDDLRGQAARRGRPGASGIPVAPATGGYRPGSPRPQRSG